VTRRALFHRRKWARLKRRAGLSSGRLMAASGSGARAGAGNTLRAYRLEKRLCDPDLAKLRCYRVDAANMTRDEETSEIDRFLASRGATKGRPAYVGPTSTNFSAAEEARRIERVKVKTASRRDILVTSRRFYMRLPF
jgi:hypothetical protein